MANYAYENILMKNVLTDLRNLIKELSKHGLNSVVVQGGEPGRLEIKSVFFSNC